MPIKNIWSTRLASSFFGSSDRASDIKEIENPNPVLETPDTVNSQPSKLTSSVTCSQRNVVPRQVWVESLIEGQDRYLDIVDLHPDVFATFPRLDLVHLNLYWQAHYRIVVSVI